MLLADLGADVIVVGGGRAGSAVPAFSRGKRFISLDLKSDAGKAALQRLTARADVLIEGFRPGVSSRIGADPIELRKQNPGLIYCALTGYGQGGPRSQAAGHDINYVAMSGILGAIGPAESVPYAPLNLLADFSGGSLVAAFGIVSALVEKARKGLGRTIDAAMIDGCVSMMAMHYPLWKSEHMEARGKGLLSGNTPFYRTYRCSDERFVAVGALEASFFHALWTTLQLGDVPDHMARSTWPAIELALTKAFAAQPRDHWAKVFLSNDACVTPVLDPGEVWADPQIRSRLANPGDCVVPVIPRFDGGNEPPAIDMTDRTYDVLSEAGFEPAEIEALTSPAVEQTGLSWPPVIR
jgi:alpha-methylacyl-CoA racemase